jgi:hypothetical protein
MLCHVLCSGVLCYAAWQFFPTSYLPVLVLNCDYWIAGVDAWSPRAMCEALFGAALCSCAMPCLELFLSCWSSLRYVLVSYGCVAPGVCAARVECAVCYSAPASLIQPGVSLG